MDGLVFFDSKDYRENLDRYHIARDDLLIAMSGATTGKLGFNTHDLIFYINQRVGKFMPSESLDRRFLYHFLSTKVEENLKISAGAAQPNLSTEQIRGFLIPLPPLNEQHRIVSILDEAFEGVATVKANAEKNRQNARAVFESHLESVFGQRMDRCVETTLGDEIDILAGFAFKSAQYTDSEDSVRLLRGDNIVQGSLRWDDVKKWSAFDTSEYSRYQLREGDIVLAMDRPWVKAGLKHAMISELDLPCLLVQRTARFRCGPRIDHRFLMFLIGCSKFTHHIIGAQTGLGVPHISGQQIRDFIFWRPPLIDQSRIADNLEGLRAETQRLEAIYQQKLTALEKLKKSLLHQAFNGQL